MENWNSAAPQKASKQAETEDLWHPESSHFFEFLKSVKFYYSNGWPQICVIPTNLKSSKSWPILKIQKYLSSQDVKDSERFKKSSVSACLKLFKDPQNFNSQFEKSMIFIGLFLICFIEWVGLVKRCKRHVWKVDESCPTNL